MNESADGNPKFDEYDKKLNWREENTVGKGEIARYEQFLLFPTVFSKDFFLVLQTRKNNDLFRKELMHFFDV